MSKTHKTYQFAIVAIIFIWCGMVLAISFLEAWLKFQAAGVTLSIGLGIGRLVFGALNKIECVFAVIILVLMWLSARISILGDLPFFIISCCILLIQTFWLLPSLDAVADSIINGVYAASGYLHISYIVLEAIKVFSLIAFGTKQFYHSKFFT